MKFYELDNNFQREMIDGQLLFDQLVYDVSDESEELLDKLRPLFFSNKSLLDDEFKINITKKYSACVDNPIETNVSSLYSHVPQIILDDISLEFFKSHVKSGVEYVPVYCEGKQLHLLYINNLTECYELEDAYDSLESYHDENKVKFSSGMDDFYFKKDEVTSFQIFRTFKQKKDGRMFGNTEIFVNEEFANLIKESGLTGVDVYESSTEPTTFVPISNNYSGLFDGNDNLGLFGGNNNLGLLNTNEEYIDEVYRLTSKLSEVCIDGRNFYEQLTCILTQDIENIKMISTAFEISSKGHTLLEKDIKLKCIPSYEKSIENPQINNIIPLEENDMFGIILDEVAVEFFKKHITTGVEYIPIDCKGTPMFLLYVTNIIEKHTLANTVPSDDIIAFEQFGCNVYIKKDCINDYKIFRFSSGSFCEPSIFVSAEFSDIIDESGLTGTHFYCLD